MGVESDPVGFPNAFGISRNPLTKSEGLSPEDNYQRSWIPPLRKGRRSRQRSEGVVDDMHSSSPNPAPSTPQRQGTRSVQLHDASIPLSPAFRNARMKWEAASNKYGQNSSAAPQSWHGGRRKYMPTSEYKRHASPRSGRRRPKDEIGLATLSPAFGIDETERSLSPRCLEDDQSISITPTRANAKTKFSASTPDFNASTSSFQLPPVPQRHKYDDESVTSIVRGGKVLKLHQSMSTGLPWSPLYGTSPKGFKGQTLSQPKRRSKKALAIEQIKRVPSIDSFETHSSVNPTENEDEKCRPIWASLSRRQSEPVIVTQRSSVESSTNRSIPTLNDAPVVDSSTKKTRESDIENEDKLLKSYRPLKSSSPPSAQQEEDFEDLGDMEYQVDLQDEIGPEDLERFVDKVPKKKRWSSKNLENFPVWPPIIKVQRWQRKNLSEISVGSGFSAEESFVSSLGDDDSSFGDDFEFTRRPPEKRTSYRIRYDGPTSLSLNSVYKMNPLPDCDNRFDPTGRRSDGAPNMPLRPVIKDDTPAAPPRSSSSFDYNDDASIGCDETFEEKQSRPDVWITPVASSIRTEALWKVRRVWAVEMEDEKEKDHDVHKSDLFDKIKSLVGAHATRDDSAPQMPRRSWHVQTVVEKKGKLKNVSAERDRHEKEFVEDIESMEEEAVQEIENNKLAFERLKQEKQRQKEEKRKNGVANAREDSSMNGSRTRNIEADCSVDAEIEILFEKDSHDGEDPVFSKLDQGVEDNNSRDTNEQNTTKLSAKNPLDEGEGHAKLQTIELDANATSIDDEETMPSLITDSATQVSSDGPSFPLDPSDAKMITVISGTRTFDSCVSTRVVDGKEMMIESLESEPAHSDVNNAPMTPTNTTKILVEDKVAMGLPFEASHADIDIEESNANMSPLKTATYAQKIDSTIAPFEDSDVLLQSFNGIQTTKAKKGRRPGKRQAKKDKNLDSFIQKSGKPKKEVSSDISASPRQRKSRTSQRIVNAQSITPKSSECKSPRIAKVRSEVDTKSTVARNTTNDSNGNCQTPFNKKAAARLSLLEKRRSEPTLKSKFSPKTRRHSKGTIQRGKDKGGRSQSSPKQRKKSKKKKEFLKLSAMVHDSGSEELDIGIEDDGEAVRSVISQCSSEDRQLQVEPKKEIEKLSLAAMVHDSSSESDFRSSDVDLASDSDSELDSDKDEDEGVLPPRYAWSKTKPASNRLLVRRKVPLA